MCERIETPLNDNEVDLILVVFTKLSRNDFIEVHSFSFPVHHELNLQLFTYCSFSFTSVFFFVHIVSSITCTSYTFYLSVSFHLNCRYPVVISRALFTTEEEVIKFQSGRYS